MKIAMVLILFLLIICFFYLSLDNNSNYKVIKVLNDIENLKKRIEKLEDKQAWHGKAQIH